MRSTTPLNISAANDIIMRERAYNRAQKSTANIMMYDTKIGA